MASTVNGVRAVALVGPAGAGKTSLAEALLYASGTISRQGSVEAGTSLGDASPEARARRGSTELNLFRLDYLGDRFALIDAPGAVSFAADGLSALEQADMAIVVVDPDPARAGLVEPTLKRIEALGLPHAIFVNKIDSAKGRIRDLLEALQPLSAAPLIARQIPIREGDAITGFVDLALERAFVYRKQDNAEVVAMPDGIKARETDARFKMLETLADYDDELMEQLLSDRQPDRDKVFADLVTEMQEGLIVPVLLGSAENGNGIMRLLKALRHEAPFVERTARRLKLENAKSAAQVLKTVHTAHGGKVSLVRVLAGEFGEGTQVQGARAEERAASAFSMLGQDMRKRGPGKAGDTLALGRLERIETGECISADKGGSIQPKAPQPQQAVYGLAIGVKDRKDEVKLTSAIAKLIEEDPSLRIEHAKDTHQMVLWGQGEMHLRVATERLARKYGVDVRVSPRQVPYKETIRRGTEIRGRHKKQSGGHGQFGDVVLEIKPLPRGSGFQFDDTISGGVVPKQFIPSVEIGVADYLQHGPLAGFPVVDVGVTLTDGSYHSVDSSDMAFRQAGRLAMSEGLPKCDPVLLEPIMEVEIAVPNDATARVNGMIPQRRGHILGFDAREGWPGWDIIRAQLPETEMADLIVELRSATAGVGTFSARFDHLAELTGRLADTVLTQQRQAAE